MRVHVLGTTLLLFFCFFFFFSVVNNVDVTFSFCPSGKSVTFDDFERLQRDLKRVDEDRKMDIKRVDENIDALRGMIPEYSDHLVVYLFFCFVFLFSFMKCLWAIVCLNQHFCSDALYACPIVIVRSWIVVLCLLSLLCE